MTRTECVAWPADPACPDPAWTHDDYHVCKYPDDHKGVSHICRCGATVTTKAILNNHRPRT